MDCAWYVYSSGEIMESEIAPERLEPLRKACRYQIVRDCACTREYDVVLDLNATRSPSAKPLPSFSALVAKRDSGSRLHPEEGRREMLTGAVKGLAPH
ncbi:hypothetical protein N7471_005218 [Penicillium samsonianum]|uniref:uncharacterized protein n=1 Tax=Penicillium samsonianum TaxID=1882272 RepID=UPI002548382C|nr:uncharacterized protein N7471_005218 [Penicillium samsonianum]KAJ6138732.1 hypothetical protein N7471_005218 [Penicillium samsonianum]